MKQDKGLRFNEGKTRYDLITPFATEQMAKVMTKGAEKYAERNWEKGMKWSKVLASMKRHISAFERGEDYDKETNLLHMAHVMCNAHFLTEYYRIYPQGDDRPHSYLQDLKIGLDIDEVLADWVGAWTKKFKLPGNPEHWYFDYETKHKFDTKFTDRQLDDFYLGLDARVDSISFEPHCYITSRPVSSTVSRWWLQEKGFPTRPVHTVGLGKSKVEIALEQELDIFIDDSYKNFVELNRAGVCCFLMDASHNRKYDVGFKRIKTIEEIFTR